METDEMRILLVDDDPILRDLLATSLGREGFLNVTSACSAEQAVELVDSASEAFDCFLLDIMLEGMNGIELCRRLRQRVEYRIAPIIMITSNRAKAFMDRAFTAGATDFLRKPLDQAEVAGRIRTAMLLVEVMRQEQRGRQALQTLMANAGEFDLIDTTQRLCFPDVSDMLDYFEFENRFLRLKEGQYQMNLIRLQLEDPDELCQRHSRADILKLIHAISANVGKAIQVRRLWFAYIGAGRFIFCTIGPTGLASPAIPDRIREVAREAAHKITLEGNPEVRISVQPLSERRIISRQAALSIIRKEFDIVSRASAASLPTIDIIENHLFAKIDNIFSAADYNE
ncbi:response regulator [Roseovarius spongiae]|uniref:Response regulator n=1 Tax=Roseovarius spongiae TaxID=2320272 RepID=A0A3A8ASR4_9RHOB|nr:response regulator [Roseovarius spongiae]RKF14187.1 response regulator [Roseovarius spongiae]